MLVFSCFNSVMENLNDITFIVFCRCRYAVSVCGTCLFDTDGGFNLTDQIYVPS